VEPRVGVVNFAVMGGTLLVNLAVSGYERRKGRELRSALLLSDAAHTRTDVYATITVMISLVAARLGYPVLDVVASVVIAAIIVRVGYQIVRKGLGVISDMSVIDPEEVTAELKALPGVQGCRSVRSRGPEDHVFMDLTILVAPQTPLVEAHGLADKVENYIRTRFPGVVDVVIHMEPGP
jgi:cation diffusion facilitator family transporter